MFRLKDKTSALYQMLTMIIDQFNKDPKRHMKSTFVSNVLPENDRDLAVKKEDYPCIHIFTNEEYYNCTYVGEMIYRKIRKKIPVIYFDF